MTLRHRTGLPALLAAAALVVSGCSVLTPAQAPTTTPAGATAAAGTSAPDGASHSEAPITAEASGEAEADGDAAGNVLYLQRLVQFTRQQQALADLAINRSKNPDVVALAQAMRDGRRRSVEQLDTALGKLGSSAPEPGSPEGSGWSGMLTPNQAKILAGATGAQFDRYWTAAVAMTDDEALTLSRSQASNSDDVADKDVATAQITALTSEYQTASHLAGPIDKRPALPAS